MIYEYRCICGKEVNILSSIKDRDGQYCPYCGALLTRIISKVGYPIFKGEGFYETDYKVKNGN